MLILWNNKRLFSPKSWNPSDEEPWIEIDFRKFVVLKAIQERLNVKFYCGDWYTVCHCPWAKNVLQRNSLIVKLKNIIMSLWKIISPLSSNYGCHCRANYITIEYHDDDGNILEYRSVYFSWKILDLKLIEFLTDWY